MSPELRDALIRFMRIAIAQAPAVLAYLAGAKPEFAAELALAGAIVNSIAKYMRDKGTITYKLPL